MQQPIKVLVIDEHKQYRKVLVECLQRTGFTVTGVCSHDETGIAHLLNGNLPDIALISYKTTQHNTILAAEWVKTQYPEIKVVLTTLYFSSMVVRECSRIGAAGLIFKISHSPKEISAVLTSIHKGERHFL